MLETVVKSKENEFLKARDDLVKALKYKESELTKHISQIKSYRAETELLKKQKINTDASVMGYDKMNDLIG